uniref:Cytochrome P450 n=1 Tax=Coptis japonica var. dissecta TaxID=397412 RepID=A9ZT58_COPJA|nr:cytochrome P450 [Coptis japonica var. dissecta]
MDTFSSSYPYYFLLPLLLLPLLLSMRNNRKGLPPGPPKLPIIGNLHQLGDLPHRSLWKLSEKYGPIMLLQFGRKPTLIISSAEIASEILKTHDLNFCHRPSLVGPKRLSYNCQDIVFGTYGEFWRELRRACAVELFSLKRVQSFGFVREEEVAILVKSISETSGPINLTEKLFSLTDRIVCRVAFGKSYQGRDFDDGKFHDVVYEATKMIGSFAAADFFPYYGWIIDVLSGFNSRLEKVFLSFDTFYQKVIDEHLDPERKKAEKEDIVDVLLGLQTHDQSGATRLTISQVKGILMNVFIGGVETSALTMVWTMTELARNPKVMKKVQEEIRNCVGKKGRVEEIYINQLPYFKMVVKETLRLHPPGPLLVPRECMSHCKINGYDVYPKTRVLVNAWGIARSSEYWEKPDEFIPERFQNSSVDFKGQDFEYLPFGSGRRACPGMNMGVATMEVALANLLYCFNWELPSGMKSEDVNIDEKAGITIHKKVPLHLVPIDYNWQ